MNLSRPRNVPQSVAIALELNRFHSAPRPLTKRVTPLQDVRLGRRPDWSASQGSGEPEHNKNNKHQPQNAA